MTQKQKFVQGSARKSLARPQPPNHDRRTKRTRTRSTAFRAALREQS